MLKTKEIIIVAPKKYEDLGRRLTHEISKFDGCKGAYWSDKHYKDNEFSQGGERYVIFVGDEDENDLTKDFLPVIKSLRNEAGACFGFDGSKAVVFGDGDLNKERDFQILRDIESDIESGNNTPISMGTTLAYSFIAVPVYFPVISLIVKWFKKISKAKAFKKEQTQMALTYFLSEQFDDWLGLEK